MRTSHNVLEWNEKQYTRDEKGVAKSLGAQWFWDNWQIKSAPLYREECWYHVPVCWGDDVHNLITAIRNSFGDKVQFRQIKEKLNYLTVYFRTEDEEIKVKVNEMITHTQTVLRNKGLHP